jgi:tetratricopeptide (TPR) repeat protein
MPSLAQLEEFKRRFAKIGKEDTIRAEAGLPPNDSPLPDYEPLPPPPSAEDAVSDTAVDDTLGVDDFDMGDMGDLSSLLDLPDIPDLDTGAFDEAPPDGPPQDLVLPEEPEARELPMGVGGISDEEMSSLGIGDDFLDKLGDEDFAVPVPDTDTVPDTADDTVRDATARDATSPISEHEPEENTLRVPEENTLGVPDTGLDFFDSLDSDLPELGGDEPELPADAPAPDLLAPDFLTEDVSAPEAPAPDIPEIEDFLVPGLDTPHEEEAPPAPVETESEKGRPKAKKVPDTVEEIVLSDEDFARLKKTLEKFPLNLRIACKEAIAEKAVKPADMSALIRLLTRGAPAREVARLVGKILERTITIPRGWERKTGEELEAEQASFAYVFTKKFLPVFALVMFITVALGSAVYLAYEFVYKPLRADFIYRAGYERIPLGEYTRANERFDTAFRLHRKKDWLYKYAEAFRDERQYILAEDKYDALLYFYPHDKKGALDYAAMEKDYLRNFEKADRIVRNDILDWITDDRDGLLALGDINLDWGEIDPSRYEQARLAYARVISRYGPSDPLFERMLLYFIRTDNLKEVLPLQDYFMASEKKKITPPTLAELGGYLLDKRFEEVRGVPDENIELIENIRDVLLRAVKGDFSLPEPHYHLGRYYRHYGSNADERQALEIAEANFEAAVRESPRRIRYHIDTERSLAALFTAGHEFFRAEEALVKGATLYEDAVNRRLLVPSAEFGRLYADLGDLEYFTKAGDMETAIRYYERSEANGWAPPEIQYRLGAAHYYLRQWEDALQRFFNVSVEVPFNRRLLAALGNAAYLRGDLFAAQGYYSRLLTMLERDRSVYLRLDPVNNREHAELAERLLVAQNNMGVTLEGLTRRTGSVGYRAQALGLYAESSRIWDNLSRDPQTLVRPGAADLSAPGINLAYLNTRSALYPVPGVEPQIFMQIDKDVLEPSEWEDRIAE